LLGREGVLARSLEIDAAWSLHGPARGAAGNQQPNVWPGTVLDGALIEARDRAGITDTAAVEVPGRFRGRRDNWTTH